MPTALDMARTVLGYTEGKDRAALIDYMKTGGQNIDPATRAWCASFINASLAQAGYSGTGSDLARSFMDWGQAVEPGGIQAGDIGVYPRGADPMYGHAGIVESYDPNTGMVTMVSGNAGDEGAVTRSQYAVNKALGFRRPGAAQSATGPAMPTQTYDYLPEQRRNAIASIESQGSGDYKAIGPVVNRQGNRAYGRYQVMASNIPSWTKQALGEEMTPDQFLASPEAQDKVFDTVFGGYVNKYGEQGAASMWFTGRPSAPDAKDKLGTTGRSYIDKYMAALGKPGAEKPTGYGGTQQVAGTGGADTAALAEIYSKMYGGKSDRKSPGEVLGGAIANMGAGSEKIGLGQAPSLPQIAPTILSPMSTIDPGQQDMRRQQLAMAMQRLNAGVLA